MTTQACAVEGIHETISAAGRTAPADGLIAGPGLGLVSQRHRSAGPIPTHRHRRKHAPTVAKVIRLRPHCVRSVRWARRGETVSRLTCHCGTVLESRVLPEDRANLGISHHRLEVLYARHRREVGAPMRPQGFTAWTATEGCL